MVVEFDQHARFDAGRFYPSAEELRRRLDVHPARMRILEYLERHSVPLEAAFCWPRRDAAVLSDLGVIRHVLAGNVFIFPFNLDQLGPNSYDVTLGRQFWRRHENVNSGHVLNAPQRAEIQHLVPSPTDRLYGDAKQFAFASEGGAPEAAKPRIDTYNPFDQGNVRFVWQKGEAQLASEVERVNDLKFEGIDHDDWLVMLHPHEMILAHTQEFIGGANVIATKISGKSSAGRNMIEVCSDADFGNIGFVDRWTLEITNKSDKRAIPLVVGQAYAQIIFMESQPTAQSYSGAYQRQGPLEDVLKSWTPEMMLPRMRRLRER